MKKIAIIAARWHADIVDSAVASIIKNLEGFDVDVVTVPGALEIPLKGKQLMKSGYDAVIGVAFVVDGGIYEHRFVGHAVLNGLMDVQLEQEKPFFSVILTPQKFNEKSADDIQWFTDHMVIKGEEAANAVRLTFGGAQ